MNDCLYGFIKAAHQSTANVAKEDDSSLSNSGRTTLRKSRDGAITEELDQQATPPIIGMNLNEAMGIEVRYPKKHADSVERCYNASQVQPPPPLLQYSVDDYNCLHHDLYGEHVFQLQLAILLSDPGADFTGGEFIMTEQRPRMQSRPMVVPLRQGDGVVFAEHNRPVQVRVACIASTCGTASAASGRGTVTQSASFSATLHKRKDS